MPRRKPDTEADRKLECAEARIDRLVERAERAAVPLEGRKGRNHWTETVQILIHARREQR